MRSDFYLTPITHIKWKILYKKAVSFARKYSPFRNIDNIRFSFKFNIFIFHNINFPLELDI